MKCSEEVRRSSRAVFTNETVRQAPEQDDNGSAKCSGLLRRDEMVLRQDERVRQAVFTNDEVERSAGTVKSAGCPNGPQEQDEKRQQGRLGRSAAEARVRRGVCRNIEGDM